jgi:alkanesulfonate monooxygenase SsuD/methylene tetrahydromethanopterin reductase-like flavin-dependent oxidoreductase (luciferase family)
MMHLALYLEAGTHQGGWRHPDSAASGSVDWRLYKKIAQRAEAARLDLLFVADKLSIDDNYGGHFANTVKYRPVVRPEPLTLLAALAAVTDHIGIGGTVSSSYSAPYTAARQLANIDHISGGRAAWNVVTSVSDGEARNHGRPQHFGHGARYERAEEFIDVVQKLWDSWGDDALLKDAANGLFADPSAGYQRAHSRQQRALPVRDPAGSGTWHDGGRGGQVVRREPVVFLAGGVAAAGGRAVAGMVPRRGLRRLCDPAAVSGGRGRSVPRAGSAAAAGRGGVSA